MKKLILLAFILLSFSHLSRANAAIPDPGTDYKSVCDLPEVVAIKGEAGSCEVFLIPQPRKKMGGACTADSLLNRCVVSYAVLPHSAVTISKCGYLTQSLDATVLSYKVVALLKTEAGEQGLWVHPKTHTTIISNAVKIDIAESDADGSKEVKIGLNLGLGPITLTNVSCMK